MLRFGSHVSTKLGFAKAAELAAATGGNAFQYFPKNPRTLSPKQFKKEDAANCANWCSEHDMASIAHGPYLVNPAAEGKEAVRMALCTLNDLEIAEACGSVGVIVHFGTYKGEDPLQGYRNIIQWINSVTAVWQGKAKILLENQAGNHGPMGTTPEELVQIRSLCRSPEKIGYCLDTCHLFASGQWKPGEWDTFAERARGLGFWNHLGAVHLNDSLFPSGSNKDRHAAIGEGCIGADGMRQFLDSPELGDVPIVLETPSGGDGSHREQLNLLRRWTGEVREG
jgi:deoxyribonuclease IV